MQRRILFILSTFIFHIVLFLILKVLFTIIHASIGGGVSISDLFAVLFHGLPLDMSTSGYLTAFPALMATCSVWLLPDVVKKILTGYWAIIIPVLIAIFVIDVAIYPYWGYHFDATIFLYMQKPTEALASAPLIEIILGVITFLVLSIAFFFCVRKLLLNQIAQLLRCCFYQ